MKMKRTTVIALGLYIIATSAIAKPPDTPHKLIKKLGHRIYVISEVGGKDQQQQYDDVVKEYTDKMLKLVKANDTSPMLLEKDKKGKTPLISASFMGYTAMAEALLTDKAVLSAINEKDARGLTAWDYSNFAFRQSLFVCNPSHLNDIYVAIPFLVTQAYYAPRQPYKDLRTLLEQKGAEKHTSELKELWHTTCVHQSPESKDYVSKSSDILDGLIKWGNESLTQALRPQKQQ